MERLKFAGLMVTLMMGWGSSAQALPYLQLDITNGTYNSDQSVQSTFSTSTKFDLWGLVDTTQWGTSNGGRGPNAWTFSANDNFRLAVALVFNGGQVTTSPIPNFGSFTLGNTTYNSSNFVFGTPPANDNIPAHGIYQTWWTAVNETPLDTINGINRVTSYDVQTTGNANPALDADPTLNAQGKLAFFKEAVDISNLAVGYALHFDFYILNSSNDATAKVVQGPGGFAPFSHDAQSCQAGDKACDGGTVIIEVPEPEMTALMGIGLLAMALAYSRRAIS